MQFRMGSRWKFCLISEQSEKQSAKWDRGLICPPQTLTIRICVVLIAYDFIACLVIALEQDSLDILVWSYDNEKSLVCALHPCITS